MYLKILLYKTGYVLKVSEKDHELHLLYDSMDFSFDKRVKLLNLIILQCVLVN